MSRFRDRYWMEQALALAATAEWTTRPNPRVGCLLVRDDRAVGRGCHQTPGQAHAEALAVAEAGSAARGSTLYVNLEPCAHHGRTPPCTELLVEHGIRRVVAAIQDPNPQVDGQGFDRLRQAGIEIDVGLLAEASQRLNEPFFHAHRESRPLVTLKAAISLDGQLSARDGHSRWISGEPARRFTHRLRKRHDAILVGAGTVRRDDPALDVRLPGLESHPMLAVLSGDLDLDPAARIFRERPPQADPVRIYTRRSADDRRVVGLEKVARIVRVDGTDAGLDLSAVLADLADTGVQALLVEGGGKTIAGFLQSRLADRMHLFLARCLLGAGGATALVDAASVASPAEGFRLDDPRQWTLGQDLLLEGRIGYVE